MTDSYLVPTWIPERTMKHIYENHEQHISRQEIHEVLHRDIAQLEIVRSAGDHQSDVMIRGKTLDGKRLCLCAIVNKERILRLIREFSEKPPRPAGQLGSIVYNGWEI